MSDTGNLTGEVGASFYADVVRVNYSTYTFALDFGLTATDGQIAWLGTVRLSPPTAAIFAKILSHQIGQYEIDNAPIVLSEATLRQTGLLEGE